MQLLNGEARAMRNYIDGVDHELTPAYQNTGYEKLRR